MTPPLNIELSPDGQGPITKFRGRATSWLQMLTVLIALAALIVGTLGAVPKCGDIQSKTVATVEHKELRDDARMELKASMEINERAHDKILGELREDRKATQDSLREQDRKLNTILIRLRDR